MGGPLFTKEESDEPSPGAVMDSHGDKKGERVSKANKKVTSLCMGRWLMTIVIRKKI